MVTSQASPLEGVSSGNQDVMDHLGFRWLTWASEAVAHTLGHLSSVDTRSLPLVAVGDEVWVRLGSNRGCLGIVHATSSETVEASLAGSNMNNVEDKRPRRRIHVDGKGRNCTDTLIHIDDDREVACGYERLTRVFAATANTPYITVVADTLEFRHLARTQVRPTDHVIEIGSSTGLTTAILHSQAASAVGFDVSIAQIAEARNNNPQCKFEFLDLFSEPDRLKDLPEAAECNVAFVDIGGDREVSQVIEAIRILREHCRLSLRLVVVKSEELFAAMNTWGFDGLRDGTWQLRCPDEFLNTTHASVRREKQLAPKDAVTVSAKQQKKKKALCCYAELERLASHPLADDSIPLGLIRRSLETSQQQRGWSKVNSGFYFAHLDENAADSVICIVLREDENPLMRSQGVACVFGDVDNALMLADAASHAVPVFLGLSPAASACYCFLGSFRVQSVLPQGSPLYLEEQFIEMKSRLLAKSRRELCEIQLVEMCSVSQPDGAVDSDSACRPRHPVEATDLEAWLAIVRQRRHSASLTE